VNKDIKIMLILIFTVIALASFPSYANSQKVVSISAGMVHNMVLLDDGTVWGWGSNDEGQLGIGNNLLTPVSIPAQAKIANVTEISTGLMHSLALKDDGTVWAAGDNRYYQLGRADLKNSSVFLQVDGLTNITEISAGAKHNIALRTDGTVWSWGANDHGQLGDGTLVNSATPVRVLGLENIIAVCGSGEFAIKDDGSVWTWGDTVLDVDTSGHVKGDAGTYVNCKTTPFQLNGIKNITSIDTDGSHTILVDANGTAWTWGFDEYGQLGDGTNYMAPNPPFVSVPIKLSNLDNVKAVITGSFYSLALKSDGSVWAWGSNDGGQHGDGTIGDIKSTPTYTGLDHVEEISAGSLGGIALKDDNTVYSWGGNGGGQLGNGSIGGHQLSPIQVIEPWKTSDNSTTITNNSDTSSINSDTSSIHYPSNDIMYLVAGIVLLFSVIVVIYFVAKSSRKR